ncbi:MAG: thiamine biosynthesis protein ThiS [Synechococcaceae cyanobacterium SM2_3_2]|nr:thiamine biosynthesis protein ThiS [Synechococcaceae cyanobacterium SM2_3_2]
MLMSTCSITVNGEAQTMPESLNVTELLAYLQLDPRMVALEYNGEILHRQHWPITTIRAGDRFEIVTMVGGG